MGNTLARQAAADREKRAGTLLLTEEPAGGSGEASLPGVPVVGVLPEQILHDDEVVLLLIKPSVFFIFYMSFRFVVTTWVLGVLAVRLMGYWQVYYVSAGSVATIAAAVSLGRLIWALLVWTSHVYMLTNQRIVTIKGVVNVRMFQAGLRKVQKTELYKPWTQRLVGTGTIGFATAAAAGGADSSWVMIARPEAVHESVVAAINKAGGR